MAYSKRSASPQHNMTAPPSPRIRLPPCMRLSATIHDSTINHLGVPNPRHRPMYHITTFLSASRPLRGQNDRTWELGSSFSHVGDSLCEPGRRQQYQRLVDLRVRWLGTASCRSRADTRSLSQKGPTSNTIGAYVL